MMANDAMTHLTTGAVVVYFLQWAKAQNVPVLRWISEDSTTLNRILSALIAGVLAFGINWTGDASTGWTIHVPPVSVLIAGGWEWLKQFSTQQLLYDGVVQRAGAGVVKPTAPPPQT
jgi:hypothetical protein